MASASSARCSARPAAAAASAPSAPTRLRPSSPSSSAPAPPSEPNCKFSESPAVSLGAMNDLPGEDARGLAALGTAIETLRTQADLSAEELAARAELPGGSLTAIEAGQEEPTWGDLRQIAHALGVPLKQLLQLAERLEKGETGET